MITRPVTHLFALPDDVKSERLIANISSKFKATFPPSRRLRLQYYDSFDWRLHERGLLLIRINDEYRLRRIDDDTTVGSCRAPGGGSFWWEFPDCVLRDRIQKILEERALIEIGDVGLRVRDVRILNTEEKTVVRARLEEGEAFDKKSAAAPIRVVNVLPVRGYGRDAKRLAKFLADTGLHPTSRSPFEVAVEMKGREPGDYNSKLILSLNSSMTGQEAAALIFSSLADTMERNEFGIAQDIDIEFLHDFRVAVRRTRSGISQLKGVFPPAVVNDYGARFAKLGRSTNRLRDLDVYLLRRSEYRRMIAEDLRPALGPLFESIEAERKTEHLAVVRVVKGREYRELVKEWRETLDAAGAPALDAKNAKVPIGTLSRRFITKWYGRVTNTGRLIDDVTPDGALHALRIECKKLRYLLEFFASLYPAEEISVFVKQLKRLQDNLGDFNDLCVQQADLKSYLQAGQSAVPVDTAAALGALLARLEDRQTRVRKNFSDSFAAFSGEENRSRFDVLFGKSRG